MLENYISKYEKDCQQYKKVEGLRFGNEVAGTLKVIREEKEIYKDYVSQNAIDTGYKLERIMKDAWTDVKESVIRMIKEEIPLEYPYVTVWWYSVLLGIMNDASLFKEFVFYVRRNRRVFSANTQFYLYYQIKSLAFRFSELDDSSTKEEIWHFYKEIVEEFANEMCTSLRNIPHSERNKNLILVITEQFISIQHGPTKTALDRCKILIDKMGKEVLLLNTAEVLSNVGQIPFLNMVQGSYIPEKMWEYQQIWKETVVPYYQCANNMPNVRELDGLLQEIREAAPEYVVAIGGSSILANLVNKMIPVITVGLGPADLEVTTTKYQTLSRKCTESDRRLLGSMGYTENHIIESIFTSSLKPQTEKITRKEVGISDEKFLIIVVGARLDDEVTDEFLSMLNGIIKHDMQIGFLGNFSKYESYLSKYPKLYDHASNFGFCNDILSRLEICDLYVNPLRKGGGTSCVEALFKGIPVVSVNYGDVSVNVGEEFCVKDYTEMQGKILKYYDDKSYYAIMSEKAVKRAEILLDTESEFVRIMQEVDFREQMEEK